LIPDAVRRRVYLFALERGFLDAILDRLAVEPFHRVARWFTRLDRFLCDFVVRAAPSILVDAGESGDD